MNNAAANPTHRPRRLCIMTTPAMSLVALHRGLYPFFQQHHWQITTISGPGEDYLQHVRRQNVRTVVMPLVRTPAPLIDLWCLVRLWWYLLWHRFDIIHVSTPKASLLGMLAAFFSGHRRRVFTCRGRAHENYRGFKRRLFLAMDAVVCRLARRVIPICRELGQALVDEGVCRPDKISFIGASSNGVDTRLFCLTDQVMERGRALRRQLGIADDDQVILSIGRVRAEKGINELVRAFEQLSPPQSGGQLHLVLLGPVESVDPLDEPVRQTIDHHPRIHTPGRTDDPVPWYALADLVAFPTWREGFGNISIEAAAMERPIVASDIMGCREGVRDGETGLLVPVRTVEPLAEAMQKLVDSPDLRRRMGQAGRKRVVAEFQPRQRWDGILAIYDELLGENR